MEGMHHVERIKLNLILFLNQTNKEEKFDLKLKQWLKDWPNPY